MAFNILIFFLLHACIEKVFSSLYEPPVNQYYQLSRFEPQLPTSGLSSFPTVGIPSKAPPPFSSPPLLSNESPYPSQSIPRYPPTRVPTQARPPLPKVPTLVSDPCPCSSKPPSTKIDPSVINNLAIALQLLIVHDILNIPKTESCSNNQQPTPYPKPSLPSLNQIQQQFPNPPLQVPPNLNNLPKMTSQLTIPQQQPTFYQIPPTQTTLVSNSPNPVSYYTYESVAPSSSYNAPSSLYNAPSSLYNAPSVMPNANFVGSSYGGTGSVMSSFTSPYGRPSAPYSRTGLSLMSPYEAIASNSPFSDSFGSSFSSKSDFQSPYQAIMAADSQNDLFSMDFF